MTGTTLKIEDIIPHRDRMKLVDEIIELSDDAATTAATATARWPLYRDGFIDALVAVELVAQTAAVSIGAKRKRESGSGEGRGWIVGIKKAEFNTGRIPENSRLITRAYVVLSQDAYSMIEGVVASGDTQIAKVSLQVFREEY
jgi:predicted hotdog family 3-hydroxylacyl-ACP dehydratase